MEIFTQQSFENFFDLRGFNICRYQKIKNLPPDLWNFSDDHQEATLFLIGSGGKKLWEIIKDSKSENPFDDYSLETAQLFSKLYFNQTPHFLYPDHHVHFPLQKLSRAMEMTSTTPLGIDIHPEYGVWFGFRALFILEVSLPNYDLSLAPTFSCDSCSSKDCLKIENGDNYFDEARKSCPHQSHHQYTSEQLAFHQKQTLRIRKNEQ